MFGFVDFCIALPQYHSSCNITTHYNISFYLGGKIDTFDCNGKIYITSVENEYQWVADRPDVAVHVMMVVVVIYMDVMHILLMQDYFSRH